MANKSASEAEIRFSQYFFPPPPPGAATSVAPVHITNPFEALERANSMSESELNTRFVELINHHDLIPGFKMTCCGQRPDPTIIDDDRHETGTAIYLAEDAPAVDDAPQWADQLIPVVFKPGKGVALQDPFIDVEGGAQPAGALDYHTQIRGLLNSYAECLFAVQQRLAVFILLVIGRTARFIRSDRSGSISTITIDYHLDWQLFVEILWRIGHCSKAVLGLDPTARRLSPTDPLYALMTEHAAPHEDDVDHQERLLSPHEYPKQPFVFSYVREAFRQSLDSNWPRYCVEVPDGNERRCFLICKPRFRAKGLSGRGTRGYVALDCQTKRFVWLKDAWRARYLLTDCEGDILQRLNDAKVPRVPTVVCHGDIDDQVTLTPQCWEDQEPSSNPNPYPTSLPSYHVLSPAEAAAGPDLPASKKRKYPEDEQKASAAPPLEEIADSQPPFREDRPFRRYKHYRLVEEEVALPLSEFQNGRQLIQIVRECVIAHYHATTDAKLLHCDISSGNILIYPKVLRVKDSKYPQKYHLRVKFTGLLADWEMAKSTDPKQQAQHQTEHIGTWQYMSVALSSDTKAYPEVCDEIESFFYVILYQAVRYLQSNMDCETVANYIDDFFNSQGYVNGRYTCGNKKFYTILGEISTTALSRSSLHPPA
ncbi:hypothetical protein C8T65DRAFT_572319 [Cerioporus squamosus]|nr:hypothetical protein C8T65DRAFT_572319 [Cerioporus squamosus]